MAVVLSLTAALSWGTSDFLGGLAGRRSAVDVSVATAFWSQIGGLVGAVLLVLATGGDPLTGHDVVISAFAGGAGAIAVTALYRGLRVGRMGVVAPITGAMAAALPVVVAAIGGERPSTVAWAGVVAAILAIVLVSRPAAEHRDPERVGRSLGAGVVEALIAGAGFAAVFVLLDATGSGTGMRPFVPMKLTASVLLLAVGLLAHQPLTVERPVVPLLLGVGVLDNAANVAFLLATRSGLLTVAAVLSSLYPVATVVLARFREHEHLARHQHAGLVLALVGIVAVAAG